MSPPRLFATLRLPRRRPAGNAAPSRLLLLRRPGAPPFWRNIAPRLEAAPERRAESPDRQRLRLLVLEARRIPFMVFEQGTGLALYVPLLLEDLAIKEILEFEAERDSSLPTLPPPRPCIAGAGCLFLALIAWHGLRYGWWGSGLFGLPAEPDRWLVLGGLDAYRTISRLELGRCLTALTLHADSAHLFGNILFGGLFMIPLCRRAGLGLGIFLTVSGGALGNLANAMLRPAFFISQGFSTSVFAAVGALTALSAWDALRHSPGTTQAVFRRAMPPLAAGLALLALLGGSEAKETDFAAHILGLGCGAALGFSLGTATLKLEQKRPHLSLALQSGLFVLVPALFALAWRLACFYG